MTTSRIHRQAEKLKLPYTAGRRKWYDHFTLWRYPINADPTPRLYTSYPQERFQKEVTVPFVSTNKKRKRHLMFISRGTLQ